MKKSIKLTKTEIDTLITSTKDDFIKELRHELFEKLSVKKVEVELTLSEKMFLEQALRELFVKLGNGERYLPILNSIWKKLDI